MARKLFRSPPLFTAVTVLSSTLSLSLLHPPSYSLSPSRGRFYPISTLVLTILPVLVGVLVTPVVDVIVQSLPILVATGIRWHRYDEAMDTARVDLHGMKGCHLHFS